MELRNLGWPFLIVELLTMKSVYFLEWVKELKQGLNSWCRSSKESWSNPHNLMRASSCLMLNKNQNGLDNGFFIALRRILPLLLLTLSIVNRSLNNGVLFARFHAASSINVMIMSSCSSWRDEQKADMVSGQQWWNNGTHLPQYSLCSKRRAEAYKRMHCYEILTVLNYS